jgi:hypothetical protein
MQDSIKGTLDHLLAEASIDAQVYADAIAYVADGLEKREREIYVELQQQGRTAGLDEEMVTAALDDSGLGAGTAPAAPDDSNGYDEAVALMNRANQLIVQASVAMQRQHKEDSARLEEPF